MRHVILYNGADETAARGIVEALRAAGVSAASACGPGLAPDPSQAPPQTAAPAGKPEASPLAVLFDVVAGSDMAELHAGVVRAASAWPGVPLVACQRDACAPAAPAGRHPSQRFDDSTLMRLGFHAVADEPTQLPALLREVEERGAAEEARRSAPAEAETAPASILLPDRLSTERLRAAFEMVASLHFAADQRGAASTALAGLASLVAADRWTIYMVSDSGKVGEAVFEPLAVRGLTQSERALPEDGDWRRALMGDAMALAGAHSRAAREAARGGETVVKKENSRRVVAVPLVSGERVAGVLEAVREGERARPFSQSDASLLSALSLPLTAALSNSARVAEAERLSQTDDLTNLHNAR